MSIWNGNYQAPLWSGTNSITSGINSNQLISTVTGLGTIGYISSSQLLSSITSIDNILSTILSTTAGGGSNNLALWANYPAITNINANGNSLINANNVNASNINTNNINGYLGNNINVNNTLIVNSNFSAKGISSLTVSTNSLTANYLSNSSNNLTIATDITLSNHTIRNIDQIGVNSIYANNGKIINIFNDTNYNNNSIYNVNSISSSVISTGILNVSSISTNFLSLSSIGGIYGDYVSTTFANLSNASTTITPSNWANYPAVNDVNLSNHNMNNGNTITSSNLYATNGTTTQSLYVGTGGQIWAGNAQFNKIDYGNYRNFTMDANVTVANNTTISCPNYTGYYSNYYLGANSVDFTGFLTNATVTNAQLQLNTVQSAFLLGVIPFGNAELSVNDYQFTFPPVIGPTYNFRGQTYFGTRGQYPAFVRMNSDSTTLLPDTSALLEISATSAFGVGTILGTSRITTTCGRNQILSGFTNQIYAGYLSVLAPFTFANICSIDQTANFGPLGGGVTVIATNGGGAELGAVGLGARTDLVANNWITSNQSGVVATSEMNIFCTDIIYLYSEGDTYLGWGNGSNARYGSNREQRTHLSNLFDISPTANGVTNWYGNLDMCNNSIYNVNLNLSTASFSTITTGHLEVFNNIYQSNARNSLPSIVPYYPYINTNAIEMLNSFSSIQSYISTTYYPMTQTITDTPHNIYAPDFGYTFYSGYTTTDTFVNIQSGNGELRFYNTGTTSMHFNFYFSPPTTPVILPGASLRIIVSNSNSYIADSIPLAVSTIFSTVSINKTNFYQDMYDTILSIDISGYNLTSNYKQKGNFYLNASTITFGGSNIGLEIIGLPNDPPNYPIKFVLPTQFDSNVVIESLDTNSISTNSIITNKFNTNNINLDNTLYNSNSEIDYVGFPTIIYTTPSNQIIPYDMKLSISSVNISYQYNTTNLIDIYNTTLSSGLSYYELDSNCFGSAFSNQITSDYSSGLVLVATSSNFSDASTGFFDVINSGDIPITFLTLFPNEGVNINPNTSNRVTFNGSTYDPPISIDAITSNNLSSFTVSSLYINDTSITQNISSTVFQIDVSGYDVNNNPIILLPQFQFNNDINMNNNNLNAINTVNTSNLYASNNISGCNLYINYVNRYNRINTGIIFNDPIDMNYNNIFNVDTITLDYFNANTNANITFNNSIDMNVNNISNVLNLYTFNAVIQNGFQVDFITPYVNSAVAFPGFGIQTDYINADINTSIQFTNNSIDMNVNSISNVANLIIYDSGGNSYITNDIMGYLTLSNDFNTINLNANIFLGGDINLNYNNILNVNGLTLDNIYANTGTDVYFNNNVNFNNYGIDNCQAIRVDYIYANLNGTPVFPDGMQVDTIGAYVTGKTTFNTDIDMNTNNISNINNINPITIYFPNGSIINETNIGGSNYLQLSNQTVVQSNLIIVGGSSDPILYFNSGKTGSIDYYTDFKFSDNINLNSNTLYNVNAISSISISTGTLHTSSLTVSTINNSAFPLIQFGSGTDNNTITLPKGYGNTNYQILLTQRGASAVIPLYSSNITPSNFYVGGSTSFHEFSWMTIGF